MRLIVHHGGALTTVQDLGRPGYRRYGVPVCGAMDPVAHRVANLLVGNDESAATLECMMIGPVLSFTSDALVAICGACPAHPWTSVLVPRGRKMDLRRLTRGHRIYLAIAGGIGVPEVLGSRSTDLRSGIGGLHGRRLREGDRLDIAAPKLSAPRVGDWRVGRSVIPAYSNPIILRVIPGEDAALVGNTLFEQVFTVSPDSDRVGIRLNGRGINTTVPGDLPSRIVLPGTVQLPPDGHPIILGPDAGTIGGYAALAHVISADLPLLAQARPGDLLRFVRTDLSSARNAWVEQQRRLAILAAGLSLR